MNGGSPVDRAGPFYQDLALVLKWTVKRFCDHTVSEPVYFADIPAGID